MKFNNILTLILFSVLFWSCNDDFLERFPESELNGENFFGTEESLKSYNNSIYHLAANADDYKFLLGFNDDPWQSTNRGMYFDDVRSDNMAQNNGGLRYLEEIAAGLYDLNDENSRSLWGWHWQQLYNINYLLENYHKATATDQDTRDIYAGEARLFRAAFYFDKVKRYGAVPWIDKSLNIDSPELFGARTPRETLMAKVLEDINFAIDHLPDEWSSAGDERRMTRSIALALKSRICLHEGTFRKYHNIGSDADTWLEAAADAAGILINEGRFSLYTAGGPGDAYSSLFKQTDLTGNPEVLLFRKYVKGVNGHAVHNAIKGKWFGLTKDFVEDYLCDDGEPIALSTKYLGDATREDELKHRDPRLRQTIVFPENVPNAGDQDWKKYLVKFKAGIPGETGNRLRTSTGYGPHKFFSFEDWTKGYRNQENDAIIIRYGEVLLNYAEAKAELGTISQDDLDISINKLRDRVGMVHLTPTPALDPKYADEGLSPIIIEVRRERRVELALEGFRYDDLMRWKKGAYLTKPKLGMRFEDAVANQFTEKVRNTVKVTTIDGKKYIHPYMGTAYENRTFDEGKHYYFPIPQEQIALNPELIQNPGW